MGEPWGLTGPEFLALYWEILGLAVVAVIAGAIMSRRPSRSARLDDAELDAYELAMLAGGPKRVEATAIAGLVASEALRISRRGIASPTGVEPRDAFQRFVLGRVGGSKQLFSNVELGLRYSAVGRELTDRLVERGYLATARTWARKLHWIIVAVGALGIVRLINGVSLDRPVGWLFLSLLATAGVWFLVRKVLASDEPFATRSGRAVVARAEARTPRAEHTSASGVAGLSGAAVLGGVALYGLAAYPDAELGEVFLTSREPAYGGGSGGSGCGSTASSCSSGGSSCGGGGGGGGGGCGG